MRSHLGSRAYFMFPIQNSWLIPWHGGCNSGERANRHANQRRTDAAQMRHPRSSETIMTIHTHAVLAALLSAMLLPSGCATPNPGDGRIASTTFGQGLN